MPWWQVVLSVAALVLGLLLILVGLVGEFVNGYMETED